MIQESKSKLELIFGIVSVLGIDILIFGGVMNNIPVVVIGLFMLPIGVFGLRFLIGQTEMSESTLP